MKKLFLLLISCIFAFSCVFALGCSCSDEYTEPCKDGEHIYGAWVYQNDATCLKDGTEIRSCKNPYCHSSESRVKAGTRVLVHNIVFVPEADYKCVKDGTKAHYKCTICGTLYQDQQGQTVITDDSTLIIPKTDHVYEDVWTTDQEPSGYEEGSESRHCIHFDKCGEKTDEREILSWTEDDNWTEKA